MKREEAVVVCSEVLFCSLPEGSEGNNGHKSEYSVSGFRPETQVSRYKMGSLHNTKYEFQGKNVGYCAVKNIAVRNGTDS